MSGLSRFSYREVARNLAGALGGALPGVEGQIRMAPRPRRGWHAGVLPEGARVGAAALLVFPREGVAHVLLTVRSSELPHHPGQVSLPGGAVEAGESLADASLREAWEEVGVEPERVRMIGPLTPLHIPVSDFVLHPLVGLVDEPPDWQPRVGEVERILEARLDVLANPQSQAVERTELDGRERLIPCFRVMGEQVWGATAMVLSELLTLLGHPPSLID